MRHPILIVILINLGVAVSILLLVLVTKWPPLAGIFHFQALPLIDFLVLLAISSLVLWAGNCISWNGSGWGGEEERLANLSRCGLRGLLVSAVKHAATMTGC